MGNFLSKYVQEWLSLVPVPYSYCKNGDLINLKKYILKEGFNVNHKYNKKNLLYYACKYGHINIINFLLTFNSTNYNLLNINENCDGIHTPLEIAAIHGHIDIVVLLYSLVKNHGDVLWYACKNNDIKLVKLLVKYCDINKRNTRHLYSTLYGESSLSVLSIACMEGSKESVIELIQNGVTVNESFGRISVAEFSPALVTTITCCNTSSHQIDIIDMLISNEAKLGGLKKEIFNYIINNNLAPILKSLIRKYTIDTDFIITVSKKKPSIDVMNVMADELINNEMYNNVHIPLAVLDKNNKSFANVFRKKIYQKMHTKNVVRVDNSCVHSPASSYSIFNNSEDKAKFYDLHQPHKFNNIIPLIRLTTPLDSISSDNDDIADQSARDDIGDNLEQIKDSGWLTSRKFDVASLRIPNHSLEISSRPSIELVDPSKLVYEI
jgi:hypothetical protein